MENRHPFPKGTGFFVQVDLDGSPDIIFAISNTAVPRKATPASKESFPVNFSQQLLFEKFIFRFFGRRFASCYDPPFVHFDEGTLYTPPQPTATLPKVFEPLTSGVQKSPKK
jgi:hypothetical protein